MVVILKTVLTINVVLSASPALSTMSEVWHGSTQHWERNTRSLKAMTYFLESQGLCVHVQEKMDLETKKQKKSRKIEDAKTESSV